MAAKATPKKAAAKAAAPAPAKKAEVKAAEVKAPVAPAAKKAVKKTPEKAPEPEKVPEKPVAKAAKVEGAKTGKKLDAKAYAAKVKADNEAAAAKRGAAASSSVLAVTEEDKKMEAIRLEKLEKKRKFLNDFTANGAPRLADDADDDAKVLWEHNTRAYNEFCLTTQKEIDRLSIPVTSASPAAHIVKFGKDGVAKKLSPEDGAKELAKSMKSEAKQQAAAKKKDVPFCLCMECKHSPAPAKCKDCGGVVAKCQLVKGSCKIKEKKGRTVCIQSAIDRELDTAYIANLKLQWGVA